MRHFGLRPTLLFSLIPTALTACGSSADPADSAWKAEVVVRDGAPLLVVNGHPRVPMLYRENLPYRRQAQGIEHYAHIAKTGVDLFVFPVGLGLGQSREQREQSWSQYTDPGIEQILRATGDRSLVLLLVVTTLLRNSHRQWAQEHPEQMMVIPPAMTPGNRASVSSPLWRRMAAAGLRDLAAHVLASGYADRIVGYCLCGAGGEWLDYWDYSPVARDGFRRWLRRHYQEHDAQLRDAWRDPRAAFDSAELPHWNEFFQADLGLFHDPARSRRLMDYFEFYHEDLAAAASELAGVLKKAVHGRQLVGLWNGYFFFPGWSPPESGIFRRRQGAFDKLLADPSIDFFVAPYSYRERHPGGVFLPQFLNDSMRLHGKLAITEEDTRTSLVPQVEDRYNPARSQTPSVTIGDTFGLAPTVEETVAVLKRNFAGCFSKPGHGLWYYCLGNNGGWYEHPALRDTLRRLRQIAEHELRAERSASQIAVIVSNRSLWYMKLTRFVDDLIMRQMTEGLLRVGAPCDVYLDTDLQHPRFPFDQYRLYVFLNTFYLDAAQRRLIKRRVEARGRTVLWIFAPGLIAEQSLSLERLCDLTGLQIKLAPVNLRKGFEVVVNDFDHPITSALSRNTRFGTSNEVGPVLWCEDPEARALGELMSTDITGGVATLRRPGGLCVKTLDDWVSVWSAAPNLPSALLRGIARQAGVHIYSDGDDVVYAGRGLLAVHTSYAGPRTLKLPSRWTAYDPFEHRILAKNTSQMTIQLPARRTILLLRR